MPEPRFGTVRKPRSLIVHPHPDVRGRKVEIREFRQPVLMACGRWTYMREYGFAAFVDGVERPGRCRTKELAMEGVEPWIDFLEWDAAGRPWPPDSGREAANA
jgi:hypothetical protein